MLPQSMSVAQIRRPKITFDSILDSLGLCHFESKMEFEHIPGSISIQTLLELGSIIELQFRTQLQACA